MVVRVWRVVSFITGAVILAIGASCGGASTIAGGRVPSAVNVPSAKGVAVAACELDLRTLALDTAQLKLTTEEGAGNLTLAVAAPAAARPYWLLQVRYDAARWHVQSAQPAAELAERCLSLGTPQAPGVYNLALTGLRGELLAAPGGVLARIELAAGPERAAAAVVQPQCALSKADDLRIEAGATDTLVWSYRNSGDYDQNGEVNVADLVPIGNYYLRTAAESIWQRAQLADGDHNGEVNVADLTVIGSNLLNSIQGYAVFEGLSETGPWIDSHQRASFAQGTSPTGGGPLRFTHKLASATGGTWYAVRANFGETIGGMQSNAVEYGASSQLRAPRNLMVRYDGTAILLEWDAPEGTSPTAYHAYASFFGAFNDPWLIDTLEPAAKLRLQAPELFEPGEEFYFAVTADYTDGQASPYSNIYHYTGTWEKTPPVWTGGLPAGGIKSAQIFADHAFITWYTAVDNISPPVRYYLYWAPSSTGIDWNNPQWVAYQVTTYTVPPLPPDVEYDFAVRAVDAVGNVTMNTNMLTRLYSTPE
jgi:hypothetical protein